MEEGADGGEVIAIESEQRPIDQRQRHLGPSRTAELVGGPDHHLHLLAGADGLPGGLDRQPEIPGQGEVDLGPVEFRPGHPGGGEGEVRELGVVGLPSDRVVALLQRDDPVGEDAIGLPGQQGGAVARSVVQVHLRLLAHLEGQRIGQDAELLGVLRPGDRQHPLGDDRIAEAVGPRGPQDVGPPLLVVDGHRHGALSSLVIRRQLPRADLTLSDGPLPADPLQDRHRQRLAGRLAEGVDRPGGQAERLAVEVHVPRGRQVDPEGPDGQHRRGGGGHALLGELRHDPERLLLAESCCLEREFIFAGLVRLSRERPPVRQVDGDRPARERCPVLIPGDRLPLHRLPPEVDGSGQVDGQIHFLELISLHLERAGEAVPARLVQPHPIRPDRGRRIDRDGLVERAEVGERHRLLQDPAAPAVHHLQPVARPRGVIVTPLDHLPDDPAERHLLPWPVGGPVGIEVRPSLEPLGHPIRHPQSRPGDVGAVDDQV